MHECEELCIDDLDLICRHRQEMFRDAGRDDETLKTMTRNFRVWLGPKLRDGDYFGFAVLQEERPIAGIGLMSIDWPPHPSHPEQAKRGYILDVYVEPDYRRRGIARKLTELAEAEFARRGVQFIIMHAIEKGRALCETLKWRGTTEMAKSIGTK